MAGYGGLSSILGLGLELSPLALFIVLFIVGSFGVGLWAAVRLWRLLPIEELALQTVQKRCQDRFQDSVTDKEVDIVEKLTAGLEPPTALACTRVRTIHQLHQRGADISRDALAATATARFGLETSILRYVSGTLILIGLMGTLVGLTQAVKGLNIPEIAAVEQEDTGQRVLRMYTMVDKLSKAIRDTLLGMRTAFFASLAAVFLTIVLSLCAHLLQHRQTVFLTALEECTTCDILPLFTSAKMETVLDTLGRALQHGLGQVLGSVEELDSRAMVVSDKLEYLFSVVQTFEAWRKQLESTLGQAAQNHVDVQRIQQTLQRTIETFFQTLDRLHSHEALQEQALVHLRTFCEQNADLPTALQQALHGQQRLQDHLTAFAARCDDIFGRRLTDLLHQHHQRILGWSETHDRFNQRLLQALDQGASRQENANSLWREFMAHYRQAEERATTQAAHHAERLEQILTVSERQLRQTQHLDQAIRHNLDSQHELQETFNMFIQLMVGPTQASTPTAEADADKQELPLPLSISHGFRALFEELRQERTAFLNALAALQTQQNEVQQHSLEQQQQLVQHVQRLLRPAPRQSLWSRLRRS